MSFVRAPAMPGFFDGIPSQYAGWVVVEKVRHVGALFPFALLGREPKHKTACGLDFPKEQLKRMSQPCTESPPDLCEACRAWIEHDRAQQDAEHRHHLPALRAMNSQRGFDGRSFAETIRFARRTRGRKRISAKVMTRISSGKS